METELRLGLPGDGKAAKSNGGKRGFHETMDLKLNFSSMESEKEGGGEMLPAISLPSADPAKPPLKAQVVGWPPVTSFRKNMAVQKKGGGDWENNEANTASLGKIGMDGAALLTCVK